MGCGWGDNGAVAGGIGVEIVFGKYRNLIDRINVLGLTRRLVLNIHFHVQLVVANGRVDIHYQVIGSKEIIAPVLQPGVDPGAFVIYHIQVIGIVFLQKGAPLKAIYYFIDGIRWIVAMRKSNIANSVLGAKLSGI